MLCKYADLIAENACKERCAAFDVHSFFVLWRANMPPGATPSLAQRAGVSRCATGGPATALTQIIRLSAKLPPQTTLRTSPAGIANAKPRSGALRASLSQLALAAPKTPLAIRPDAASRMVAHGVSKVPR